MKTAITIALVPQARQGPFVFHGDLAGSVAEAARLGFDGVEVFPPSGSAVDAGELRGMLAEHGLALAAVGTGAGWVVEKLSLTDPDAGARRRAVEFVRGIVDFAGGFGAPAIIGSMQGRHADGKREAALGWLAESLGALAGHAKQTYGAPLLYEPLNRYETNLFNRQGDAAAWLDEVGLADVMILADLFHMNIEERDVAGTLRGLGPRLGHVHCVDSNRLAAGWGHTDFSPIVAVLREVGYAGYLSAECFPAPDSEAAARQTIRRYRELLR
ncbi:MAG TPA: sugar phosphate isomerase/epimerase family protein [Tepidisphaeraceae bacterium]|nr:sugar phosphate isomerase/epimerase family protein [Tepidisphaeraceae bacterium]